MGCMSMYKKAVSIDIYPYLKCYQRSVDKLLSQGFSMNQIDSVGEGDILYNVPFSAFGTIKRAVLGKDLAGNDCAFLQPYGYKIPALFYEVVK